MCCKLILPFCILLSVENAMHYSEGYRPQTQPQEMQLKDAKAQIVHKKGVVPHGVPPYDMRPMSQDVQQQQNLQQQTQDRGQCGGCVININCGEECFSRQTQEPTVPAETSIWTVPPRAQTLPASQGCRICACYVPQPCQICQPCQ
ncbi:unnamed protein product [Litomosoides sigmodontis]|uniref:Microfilarial sheath protein SHP1a n=1 Tax=Litomosoides sigmodontis TaxID=42156 RepID=Q25398_LITSI|nr:microfilarial sheath protein SHP1a precursor [Litomosoides sigmodontis]VDK85406.1 unnamed protein product [Litomosoides sigmodontis]